MIGGYSGRGGRFGGLYPGGANGSLGLSSKSVSCGTPAAPDGLGTACALLAEDLLDGSFEPRGIAGGGPKGLSVSTPRFGCAGPAVELSARCSRDTGPVAADFGSCDCSAASANARKGKRACPMGFMFMFLKATVGMGENRSIASAPQYSCNGRKIIP